MKSPCDLQDSKRVLLLLSWFPLHLHVLVIFSSSFFQSDSSFSTKEVPMQNVNGHNDRKHFPSSWRLVIIWLRLQFFHNEGYVLEVVEREEAWSKPQTGQ